MYKIAVKTDSLVTPGINACQGCALELIMRNVLDVLGRDTVLIIPPRLFGDVLRQRDRERREGCGNPGESGELRSNCMRCGKGIQKPGEYTYKGCGLCRRRRHGGYLL